MSQESRFEKIIESKFSDIKVESCIGLGAYGAVYKCVRNIPGENFETSQAIKVVQIPYDENDKAYLDDGITEQEYCDFLKEKAVAEIKKMEDLKSPHVVHINGYDVVPREDKCGYYILIQMDLLEDITSLIRGAENLKESEAEELAKAIGTQICDALVVCESKNIIHRDIKPQNILKTTTNDYYLGDFGIAREAGGYVSSLSSRGTEKYVAPEVESRKYDHRVDLYSLGLVLYQIVNHGRLPFLPNFPKPLKAGDTNEAQMKRLSGEQIPMPDNCSIAFGEILTKLCDYNPNNRFKSAAELKDVLLGKVVVNNGFETTVSAPKAKAAITPSAEAQNKPMTLAKPDKATLKREKRKKRAKRLKIAIAWLCVIMVLQIALFAYMVINRDYLGISFGYKKTSEETAQEEHIEEQKEVKTSEEEKEHTEDTSTETVNITPISLKDITISAKGDLCGKVDDVSDTLGNKYDSAILLGTGFNTDGYAEDGMIEYVFGKDYKHMSFDVSCSSDQESTGSFYIYFNEDDDPVYKLSVERAMQKKHIDLDLTEVESVTFKVTTDNNFNFSGLLITEGLLYTEGMNYPVADTVKEYMNQAPTEVKLVDMGMVEATTYVEVKENYVDALSNEYARAIFLKSNSYANEGYVTYYLNKQYSTLSFDYSAIAETTDGATWRFEVYFDNDENPAYTVDMGLKTALTNVQLDVSGKDFVSFKVRLLSSKYSSAFGTCISNAILTP